MINQLIRVFYTSCGESHKYFLSILQSSFYPQITAILPLLRIWGGGGKHTQNWKITMTACEEKIFASNNNFWAHVCSWMRDVSAYWWLIGKIRETSTQDTFIHEIISRQQRMGATTMNNVRNKNVETLALEGGFP